MKVEVVLLLLLSTLVLVELLSKMVWGEVSQGEKVSNHRSR